MRLDVVIPAHDEERVLDASVRELHAFLARTFDFPVRVTIADSASTDGTPAIARALARELDGVRVVRADRPGRGLALRTAWAASDADVLAYMDADLATDLAALPALVGPLLDGRGDLAIGSRLLPASQVARGLWGEAISVVYNIVLRAALQTGIADAQCGFKAVRREVLEQLLPLVEDDGWFFDSELLVAARRARFAIREIPVRWTERDSSVPILRTIRDDLRGVRRLRRAARSSRRPHTFVQPLRRAAGTH